MKTKVALISLYNRELAFGVRQMSTVLRQKGHECHIIFFKQMTTSEDPALCIEVQPNSNFFQEHTETELTHLLRLLEELGPDLIGISLISPFFHLACDITARIKQSLSCPVIWGGVHPTLVPEDCIDHTDIICVGEGEEALADLAEAISRGESFDTIANLWINSDGRVIKNPLRPLIDNLDSIGFPDFDEDAFKHYIEGELRGNIPPEASEHLGNSVYIMTSRGCPFSCTYCCVKALRETTGGKGRYLRRRSPRRVIDEILERLATGGDFTHVQFWDDVFTFDARWQEEFARLYTEEIGLPFTCYAHPEITSPEILKTLKAAGLHCVNVGIQTGSERIATSVYDRRTGNDKIIEAAHVLEELGITAWYDLICDNPYEREEDSRATLELLLSLPRPFGLNMHSLCYFPRTQLTEKAIADGKISPAEVDGINAKAVTQFRVTMDRPRNRVHAFWNVLFGMTRHEFFSVDTIRALSRNGLLRRFPGLLKFGVVRILRRKISQSEEARPDEVGVLAIRHSASRPQPGTIRLRVTIENADRPLDDVHLALRTYPQRDPSYPDRYLGAWDVRVDIPVGTLAVDIEVAFPDAAFLVDGDEVKVRESWMGDIRESGLYSVETTLYDQANHPLATQISTCHSMHLFQRPAKGEMLEAVQGTSLARGRHPRARDRVGRGADGLVSYD